MDTSSGTKNSVSLVAPIYNNCKTLQPILKHVLEVLQKNSKEYEVFLIDDASIDGSREKLRELVIDNSNLRAEFHTINHGIASTYKELYKKAKFPIVILFSFDGEWNPDDIGKLLAAGKNFDIVIGKRTHKEYQFGRAAISFLFNYGTKMLFGIDPIDAGSIKRIHKLVIDSVPVSSKSVYDEAERIIRASLMGYRVGFVNVDHLPSKKKKGVFRKVPLILSAIADMFRLYFTLVLFSDSPAPTTAASSAATRKSAGKP